MSYLICYISGLLTAIPMLFDRLWLLSWISMAPFFCILMKDTPKYRHGLMFSLGYYGVLYYWFTELYPMDFAGFTPSQGLAIVIICWVGLALLQSLGTAFIGWLFRLTKVRKRWLWPLMLASCWTLLEYAQTLTWAGVPFFRLALSQCGERCMIQGASLLGSLFIGFIIAFSNACLSLGYIHECEKAKEKGGALFRFRPNVAAAVGISVIAINYICGFFTLLNYDYSGTEIIAAAIQGNISSTEKWKSGSVYDTCTLYCDLTREACHGEKICDIVLWPETAINVNIETNPVLSRQISDTAVECGCYIGVGTFSKELNDGGELEEYNALYLFCPDGSISDEHYFKRRLVPFGEFIPMASVIEKVLPLLAGMNLKSNDLTPGEGTNLISCEYGRLGGLICFDSIYETLALDSVRDGAELILLSTNDSWYGSSAAVYQHNRHAILRAVETGRYVVRSANTGISSIITPTGAVKNSLAPEVSGYVVDDVCLRNTVTVYSRVGNVIVIFSGILLCVGVTVRFSENRGDPSGRKKKRGK